MSSPVIQITSLTRRFGEKNAVDNVTLDVQAGEIFGFLGHNPSWDWGWMSNF
ncbi:MAG: hypothetical protein HUU38_02660 [Anaerolineales bacterium]|nr:hypothetical protein [Anaerolineales bacterium]